MLCWLHITFSEIPQQAGPKGNVISLDEVAARAFAVTADTVTAPRLDVGFHRESAVASSFCTRSAGICLLGGGYADRYTSDVATGPEVKSAADHSVLRNFRIFDKAIAGPYALGEKISMLDLYVWMFGQWVDQGPLSELCPNAMALSATVAARPEIAAVQARDPS